MPSLLCAHLACSCCPRVRSPPCWVRRVGAVPCRCSPPVSPAGGSCGWLFGAIRCKHCPRHPAKLLRCRHFAAGRRASGGQAAATAGGHGERGSAIARSLEQQWHRVHKFKVLCVFMHGTHLRRGDARTRSGAFAPSPRSQRLHCLMAALRLPQHCGTRCLLTASAELFLTPRRCWALSRPPWRSRPRTRARCWVLLSATQSTISGAVIIPADCSCCSLRCRLLRLLLVPVQSAAGAPSLPGAPGKLICSLHGTRTALQGKGETACFCPPPHCCPAAGG